MVRLLGIAMLVLWVWSLAESLLTPRDQVRLLPKVAWVVLIVLLGPVGAVAWLALGRPRREPGTARVGYGSPAERSAPTERRRPVRGPDDDPDFLRGL